MAVTRVPDSDYNKVCRTEITLEDNSSNEDLVGKLKLATDKVAQQLKFATSRLADEHSVIVETLKQKIPF